ncbi:MAG: hypothetical protein Q9220_001358 [cf. Caloplaca sp. 1 TL-2023]
MSTRIAAIFGAPQPFEGARRYTTSWILPPLLLAIIRLLLSIYAFTTLFFILGWDGAHRRHDLDRHSFSYFTNLAYWGLAFYLLFGALHTFSYARTGTPWLQRWPVPLQIAHTVLYTTITSQHALNTVFAAFEILLTRSPPPALAHLPIIVILLALYLALAYLTHATAGFYPYSFLDPDKGSGKLAGYILGILAAACVIFGIVWVIIWARRWLTEEKLGMHGKFAKQPGTFDEEMAEMTTEGMK